MYTVYICKYMKMISRRFFVVLMFHDLIVEFIWICPDVIVWLIEMFWLELREFKGHFSGFTIKILLLKTL